MLLSEWFGWYGASPSRLAQFMYAPSGGSGSYFYEQMGSMQLTESQWRARLTKWFEQFPRPLPDRDMDFIETTMIANADSRFIRTPDGDYWVAVWGNFTPPQSSAAAPNQANTHDAM